MTDNRSPEERLLDSIFREPRVFWTTGDNVKVQIFTEYEDKSSLFYLSDCTNSTIQYLNSHSLEDIFTGKNPDMLPIEVRIIEGGDGIIEFRFQLSSELEAAGIEDSFLLNRDLEEPRFGIILKRGHRSERFIIGYTPDEFQKPYLKMPYNEVSCTITFDIVEK